MFRKEMRNKLCALAETEEIPQWVKIEDNYNSTLRIIVGDGGDISLQICEDDVHGQKLAGITMVGVGGGNQKPLVMEALRLLAYAMKDDGGEVR